MDTSEIGARLLWVYLRNDVRAPSETHESYTRLARKGRRAALLRESPVRMPRVLKFFKTMLIHCSYHHLA